MLVDHLAEASMLEPGMAAAGAEALVVDVVVVGGRGGGEGCSEDGAGGEREGGEDTNSHGMPAEEENGRIRRM